VSLGVTFYLAHLLSARGRPTPRIASTHLPMSLAVPSAFATSLTLQVGGQPAVLSAGVSTMGMLLLTGCERLGRHMIEDRADP
jgi:hypothetical protein